MHNVAARLKKHKAADVAALCVEAHIAEDLRQPQTRDQQSAKSKGLASVLATTEHTAAEAHGTLRARSGFSMPQLVSEYRALRASVLRLWADAGHGLAESAAAEDVIRFNEAVDQAVAESVDFFCKELDQSRTAREELDRVLALQRSRLEYASRLTRVGFWYCDLPFDVLQWDERVKEHFFLPPEARVTIQDFYDRIHPDDREATRHAIENAIRDHAAYDIVYRTRHPISGQVKWIRALGGTDYASDGSPIHFDGVTVDVTEERLEEQRVVDSEARHRGVLSNMEESFTLFDGDFNIIEVNEAACRLVGIPRTDFIGANHWNKFAGTYDSDLGRMYRDVLADHKPRSLEHRYVFEDGRAYWLEARAFFVGPGVAVLYRDVTERREMIEALRDADRRKDEFLAMLAHELRNPLAPITTATDILLRKPDAPAQVASATTMIRRQLQHLTRLVDDLLDVSRITQGRIQLRREPVDMAAVVSHAVEICQSQIKARHQQLAVATAEGQLSVEGDFERLVQCVANVLTNATKYTKDHGEIRLRLFDDGGDVVVEVTDTGAGISADLLPRVFDLFVQSRRTLDRSQGGLGVGLAVVKRLVEMHGGNVEAASPGEAQGATFTIRLPRALDAGSAIEDQTAATKTQRRVLVVDDNADAADSLVVLLELEGHTVMAEHTARAALDRISSFAPDVMLIDIGLPEMNGYELAAMLRASPATARLGLIAVTGYGQPEDRIRALQAGFDVHLVKPADMEKLQRALAEVERSRNPMSLP